MNIRLFATLVLIGSPLLACDSTDTCCAASRLDGSTLRPAATTNTDAAPARIMSSSSKQAPAFGDLGRFDAGFTGGIAAPIKTQKGGDRAATVVTPAMRAAGNASGVRATPHPAVPPHLFM